MAEEKKRVVVPMVNITHNEDDSGFLIEVDLAGASKESVDLDMGTGGFCVKAAAEGMRYESCFLLAHEVKPEEAKAKFESGLLTVRVPFKESLHGHKVPIQ
ncbi:MAG: Hsp20/alpha crystallin family protein [Thermodesulfobacteriota bacterium]